MLSKTKYTKKLKSAVKDGVNPETIIYLLKNQLVDANIFNHNLKRVVSFLVWKLKIEQSNSLFKSEMINALKKEVDSLEKLMQSHSEARQQWRTQLDKYDYDIMCLMDALESRKTEGGANLPTVRPYLKRSINKASFIKRRGTKTHDSIAQSLSPSTSQVPFVTKISVSDLPIVEEVKVSDNYTSREELFRLEADLHDARLQMEYYKTMEDLFIDELNKTRNRLDFMTKQIQNIKTSAEQSIVNENKNWQIMTDTLKANYDTELGRKQEEITALNNKLAEWIIKYMELEKGKSTSVGVLGKLLKTYCAII